MKASWQTLKTMAAQMKLLPGMCFETTLLGFVPYKKDSAGVFVGYIPDCLQRDANRHGIIIEAADYQRGSYILRLSPTGAWKASQPAA